MKHDIFTEMKINSVKENLKSYYNEEAALRDSNSEKPDWKIKVRQNFYELVKQENKQSLLELGAGPGYDSQFFMSNGLNVVAIDISGEMIKKCREKSIEAYEIDYYNLTTLNKKFDSIYAINTLLHVPKDDLPLVLKEIYSVLNPHGLFYMGLYGGEDTENELVKSEISDSPRFFAYHSEKYLKTVLSELFQIRSFETINVERNKDIFLFHSIILQKKI